MKKLAPLFLFLLLLSTALSAQKVISQRLVADISGAQMDSLRKGQHVPRKLAPVRYGLKVYEIEYETTWWNGKPVKASGFFLMPDDCLEAMPMIAYAHGTRLNRDRIWKMGGEEAICAFFAADGYAVVMPDYLGLGTGDGLPIYMHAATEATAMVDMIKAGQSLVTELGGENKEQLFITGYSQGGHAAMATHQYIQQHPQCGLKVTASAPMSGAYDMVGVQSQVIERPYAHPGYLPFLLLSYQEVYHLVPDSGAFFRAPYNETLLPFFDGNHKLKEASAIMPPVPGDVVNEQLLLAYKTDPKNPLRQALQENTLLNWAPEAPMLLCYCKADEQVLYQNSTVARDSLRALGAEELKMRMSGRRFGHGICALYSTIYAKMYFDGYRDGKTNGKQGSAWKRFLVGMSKLTYHKPKANKK